MFYASRRAQGADDIDVANILGNQVLPHQIQVVQWSEFAQSGHWLRYGAIVSCVISAEYDAMDLCQLLAQEHYTGKCDISDRSVATPCDGAARIAVAVSEP